MRTREGLTLIWAVWLLSAGVVWAQQPNQQPTPTPTPPAPPASVKQPPPAPVPPPPAAAAQQPENPVVPEQGPTQGQQSEGQQAPALQRDRRPLAGAELITPVLPNPGRNYILPSFSIWEGADTNAMLTPGTTQVVAVTIPVAAAQLNHVGRANEFSLGYAGGAQIYDTRSDLNSLFQEFGFTDKYQGRDWSFLLADRYTYLPQASFGFAGIGFAGVFNETAALGIGTGLGQLNSFFLPGQSILFGQIQSISDVGVAQIQLEPTPRTSLTAIGSFAIVEYNQQGLISGNRRLGLVAWDHALTDRDTITVAYSFTALRYNGFGVAINDNFWRLGYGRRVTNRVALTLMAGPELTYAALRGVSGVQQRLSVAGQGTLDYERARTGVNLSYSHYVTAGSGLFGGALTDLASAGMHREFSRTWRGELQVGYAFDRPLGAFAINSGFPAGLQFNDEFGNLRIDRTFGRNVRAFLNYQLQREESTMVLPGATGRVLWRQVFGIGFEVHSRPLGI